ncbi:TIGR03663 family protein [Halostella sp. JP-L12]|uniref:flippase activity-associated protein Agl23 n=1 Tax=Halostella TaxID=1843185 RepID=UPI000EF82633|nr:MULTISPECIES: flippase activity-associated protein Agl23 [Halostella]NHN46853.1 TIGR03663 family protein [Halostella sp. JP-L12]
MTTGRSPVPDALSGRRGTALAVVAVTSFGFLARLYDLGSRVAHQDEARVAYWTLRYLETGLHEYRPIVHGPFLPLVNSKVFALLGPNDFTMRLVVAAIGACLPLSAWLFRDRLRDSEVVALAVVLACNPILLYYSRFYRTDVLLAAFTFFALGLFVRWYDTRKDRYLFAATASYALSFTTKENALVYALCFLGAAALLLDHRLFLARVRGQNPYAELRRYASGALTFDPVRSLSRDARASLLTDLPDAVRARKRAILLSVAVVLEFFAIVVFFYAPRKGGYPGYGDTEGMGLYWSLEELAAGRPGMFVAVVEEALVGSWTKFVHQWGSGHGHEFLYYWNDYVDTMETGAVALVALAVVGFVADRYSSEGPRDLVALGGYIGAVSVFGYPIITDIPSPWATVHAVVPLALPAAVGLAMIGRWGVDAYEDGDVVGVSAAVILVLLLVAQVGGAAMDTSYRDPAGTDNELVQYAQSSSDMKPTLETVYAVARENEGVDVMYYGDEFASPNESNADQPPAHPGGWFERLPLAWYFEAEQHRLQGSDAELVVNSTTDASEFDDDPPPVVISERSDAAAYESKLDGYRAHQHERYLHDSAFVVFVDEDYLDD